MYRFIMIISLSVGLFLSACSRLEIQSTFRNQPMTIDGNSEDWADVPLLYNKVPPLMFGAVNDSSSLELVLVFRDESLARMMISRGFSIWFDDDESFGIDCMGGMGSWRRTIPGYKPDSASSRRNHRFRPLNSGDFTAIDKKADSYIPASEIDGLDAAFSVENGYYCLELRLPLKAEKGTFGARIVSGKRVEVELKTKTLKASPKHKSTGMTGSGQRGSGGRRGGRRAGAGRMQRPDMAGKEFKATIELAG